MYRQYLGAQSEPQFRRSDTGMCTGEWLTAPSPCGASTLTLASHQQPYQLVFFCSLWSRMRSHLPWVPSGTDCGPLSGGREQEAGNQGREAWERASLTRALSYLPSALGCKHWGFSCVLWPLLLWHRPGTDILKGSSWSQFPSLELQVTASELAQAQSGLSCWHVASLPRLVPHLLPFPVAEPHTWVMTFFWLFCGSF